MNCRCGFVRATLNALDLSTALIRDTCAIVFNKGSGTGIGIVLGYPLPGRFLGGGVGGIRTVESCTANPPREASSIGMTCATGWKCPSGPRYGSLFRSLKGTRHYLVRRQQRKTLPVASPSAEHATLRYPCWLVTGCAGRVERSTELAASPSQCSHGRRRCYNDRDHWAIGNVNEAIVFN
jgi:hypothetical protein